MDINNPVQVDHLIGADGSILRFKKIDIGPWNMYNGPTTLDVALGLTWAKIVGLMVTIVDDAGTIESNLFKVDMSSAYHDGTYTILPGPPVVAHLMRRTGGQYNVVAYISAVLNRGTLIVWYLE